MSFGMQTRSRALLDVVGKANQAGVIIVASSGNDGKRRTADYPARYPQTISVGATDRNRKIPAFSNRGQFVDIYAPGDKIVSAWYARKIPRDEWHLYGDFARQRSDRPLACAKA